MKRFLLILLLAFAVAKVNAAVLYVSPTGNDAANGDKATPFATLARARDEARKLRTDATQPIEVLLRAGTHYLSEPLILDARDSGIIYRAYNDEQPIVSGGVELNLDWKPYKNAIMQAKTPAGIEEIDQLFVNGQRQHMARFPNFDPEQKFFGGTSGDAISPNRAKAWSNPAGGFMHALHSSMWGSKHYRIVDVDDNGEIKFHGGWQENRGGGFDEFYRGGYHKNYLFIENIFDELDAEGEWYFDKAARTLYLNPQAGVDPAKAKVIAAGLKELIVVKGSSAKPVTNVTLAGITFRHTKRVFMEPYERLLRGDWSIARLGAVQFAGCEDCAVADCQFEDLGGNGVFISGYNRHVNVTGSRFTRLGESGVCLVGDLDAVRSPAISYSNTVPQDQVDLTPGPKSLNYPGNCLVHNNLMHRFGIIGKQVAGVIISMAEEITVSNNTIYQCPRAAICINDGCFGGHIIEYNDAFNTVRESGDHGPFNSWGRDRWWKTANHSAKDVEDFAKARSRLDNHKVTHIRNNRFTHPGGHSWGIDLDDGSSNYHVYNNLCLGMGVKLREGYYRRVENNIIVNGFGGFHVWLPDCEDVVARNIFVSDKPYQFIRANPEYARQFDYNLFYWPDAEPRITGVGAEMSLTQWKAKGFDEHSVQAEPGFIDSENGDYRVKADSPAIKLGFKNFAMDRFGSLNAEFQAEAAKESRMFKPAVTEVPAEVRSQARIRWMGATIKNLVGEGEKSAAGIGEETGVLFVEVPQSSTAAQAGFKADDVLLRLDGKKVHSVDDLMNLTKQRTGEKVSVTVYRAVEKQFEIRLP